MSASGVFLLLFGLLAVLGTLCLWLRIVIPILLRWRDERETRRDAARDPFPAVRLPEDGERPDLICLPGGRGRGGRRVCRRAYPQGRDRA